MSDPAAKSNPWDGVSATIVHADLYPCRPDWRIVRQLLPYDGLFYIWKGHGWVMIDDERLEARPGDLFIMRRGRTLEAGHDPAHAMMPLSTGFHLRRHGDVDAIRGLALPHRLRLLGPEIPEFQVRFMDLIALHRDARPTARLSAAGALLRLVAEALRLVESLPADRASRVMPPLTGDETMAARVQAWIDAHIADRLTLTGLARVAKLTPTHFSAAFHKQTGVSPMQYLRRRRVEAARALLASGDRTVEEVARAVGYPDPFHFSRVFRALVKIAPRDYRDSLKHPFQP
ncbi:MAG: helix-turn-helix transcriptional regulator [Planctomycetes bacterium]|nr:helix-turn-helix transcriptional regulator [Planctomycetota bacterium]